MLNQHSAQPEPRTESLNLSGVLLHSVESAIVVVDVHRKVASFSRAAERFTGHRSEAVTGAPLTMLPASLQRVIEETFSSGQSIIDRTIALFPDASDKIPVRVQTSLCADGSNQPLAVIAVLNDFAAPRQLEERIRRLDRLASIGTLSAGVAHEIKNALVAIKSFTDLQAQGQPSHELSDLFRREIKRIDSLTSQLLKFAGPAKPEFSIVSLHEVIDNSLRLIQHQIKTRQIQLVRALDSGKDTVRGDAKQLEQAIINLLMNAVEAMESTGTLTVTTEIIIGTDHVSQFETKGKQQQIQLTVRDTGAGIPPDLITRLFTPFVTTKPEGTGLGLAITARIVQEHRGRITVESEVDKGTRFNVRLPLADG